MSRIIYHSINNYTSLEISTNKKEVAIFHGPIQSETVAQIAKFNIEEVWDMIRNAIVTVDAGPISNPGLFRRKGEAAAGILYTNKSFVEGDNL